MCATAEDIGICATCVNGPDCAYHHQSGEPVQECEEFRCLPAEPAVRKGPAKRPAADGAAASAAVFTGLCADCENRAKCTSLKGEGGVWHCEEYR